MRRPAVPSTLRETWRLLSRDVSRQDSGDEHRQLELCRYMWLMRHAAVTAVLMLGLSRTGVGPDTALLTVALALGLTGHLIVLLAPARARTVTIADVALLVVLSAIGLPTMAVLLISVAVLGWAATFRPLSAIGAYLAVLVAVALTLRAHETVAAEAGLLGFCLLGMVFTVRMVRLSMAARRAADRERLVEQRIDAIVWEEIPGVPGAFKVSAAAERVLGYPIAAWSEPGFWRSVVDPEDLPAVDAQMADATERTVSFRCRTADGATRWLENRVSRVPDRTGRHTFLAGVLIDRTDTIEAERDAMVFGQLVASSPIGQVLLECHEGEPVIQALNAASHRILGAGSDAVGAPLAFCGGDGSRIAPLIDLLSAPGFAPSGEFPGADGRIYQATVRRVGERTCSVDFIDVTERVEAGRRLHDQARQDDLTGLPNRRAFLEALGGRLESRPDAPAAVLIIDLDDFKDINDSLGHETGDQLLRSVGARIADRVRGADLLARLGGDEFAVLLGGPTPDEATRRAHELVRLINEPVTVGHLRLRVRASIGVANFPGDAVDVTGLMRRADGAMYEAKRRGSGVEVHQGGSERLALDRLALSSELEHAIADGQLTLRHQPLFDIAAGTVVGTEALVRWDHPTLGLIPPDEFIPLAEASGHIRDLTRWVVSRGLAELGSLGEEAGDLELSVNLSVRNLYEPDLLTWLVSELATAGVAPNRLVIEITESVMMDNEVAAIDLVRAIRRHGIRVWIDDFGTGHSSLARLRHLPIDGVKIDRSFVAEAATSPADRTMLRSLVSLIGSLGLQAIAEGVEDADVLELLGDLGCPLAQGYHLARPMPLADLRGLLVARSDVRTTS